MIETEPYPRLQFEPVNRPVLQVARRAAAIALLATALLPASNAAAGPIDGISDQNLGTWDYNVEQAAGQLKPKYSRNVVSWDVVNRPDELAKVDGWLEASSRMGLRPMISFGWPDPNKSQNVPNIKQYRRAVSAFVTTHPKVPEYTPFNEAVHYSKLISPKMAARYYVEMRNICRGRCAVAAGDFNPVPEIKNYLPVYRKELRRMKYSPKVWALHPFEGVVPIPEVRKLLPKKARLWLTESALIIGPGQANDANQLLKLKAERTYVYQMKSRYGAQVGDWDAGLLDQDGAPRPAFHVLRTAANKK